MKRTIPLLLGLALSSGYVSAQEVPSPTAVPTSPTSPLPPADQKAIDEAIDLARVATLWNKFLNWNERGSTLAEVAGHIRQNLGNDAPLIEMRGQDGTLTTFTLPQAPLGPTLTALAELGNCQVWVFPGRLLLAPETALTPTESTFIKQRTAGEWKRSNQAGGGYWDGNKQITLTAIPLVGADIKARLAAKGQTTPNANPQGNHLPFEIPFTDLSPITQTTLQKMIAASRPGSPPLDSSVTVCYDDNRFTSRLELRKYDPANAGNNQNLAWWYSSPF